MTLQSAHEERFPVWKKEDKCSLVSNSSFQKNTVHVEIDEFTRQVRVSPDSALICTGPRKPSAATVGAA